MAMAELYQPQRSGLLHSRRLSCMITARALSHIKDIDTAYLEFLTAPGRFSINTLRKAVSIFDPTGEQETSPTGRTRSRMPALRKDRSFFDTSFFDGSDSTNEAHDIAARLCEAVGNQVRAWYVIILLLTCQQQTTTSYATAEKAWQDLLQHCIHYHLVSMIVAAA